MESSRLLTITSLLGILLWTMFALGVLGAFSAILAAHELRNFKRRKA